MSVIGAACTSPGRRSASRKATLGTAAEGGEPMPDQRRRLALAQPVDEDVEQA
jgi:hypothetical protein